MIDSRPDWIATHTVGGLGSTCDAPSPGGNLRCIREPHDANEGHVWNHNAKDAATEDR